MFEPIEDKTIEDKKPKGAIIRVIGVGGCGGNTVNYMMSKNLDGVEFICTNTDVQALSSSKANCLQLGAEITKGLGAGGRPEVGQEAAKENADQIRQIIEKTDMVFITAGMGGGTGSGAAPVIAQIAKDLGVLTIAVVIKPFECEQAKRMEIAEQSINELSKYVDSLIIVSNEKLCSVFGADTEWQTTMNEAHDVLYGAVQGIAELITSKGSINLDFADIKTVMSEPGRAMISSGVAEGENRAVEAMEAATQNPLLEDMDLNNVRGLLVNISGANIKIGEIQEIGAGLKELTAANANFKMGVVSDESMGDALRITVIATGMEAEMGAESDSIDNANVEVDAESVALKTIKGGSKSASEVSRPAASSKPESADDRYDNLLDIPAFLRKQVN